MSGNAISGSLDLQFFDGFAWAVPTAFAGALAGFRFEQGDVLHCAREAYSDALGRDSGDAEALALQVLAPPRSSRGASDGEGDRRRMSFESDVSLSLVDLRSGSRRALETTQGRLLMTLWRGELGWIEGEGEAPPVPLDARALAGELEALRPAFESELGAAAKGPAKGSLFLFVVDLASDASRVKAESIREALAGLAAEAVWLDRTPAALELASADADHPALVVRGVALAGADEARVTEALRRALYGGKALATPSVGLAATVDPEAEPRPADRFSVTRHGLLVPLGS